MTMYCDPPTKMVQVLFNVAGDGSKTATATLESGQRILFSIETASGNGGFVLHLNVKDPVQLC
jgi:hypothetical protein